MRPLLDTSGFDNPEAEVDDLGLTPADRDAIERILREMDQRDREALSLYEPLPWQQKFHASRARRLIVQKGNRVGGSLVGFVEDARAALGRDPFGKYPRENGVLVCVGYGEKHVGDVIHRYLFRPGAFKIIRDLKTKLWRVYRGWGPDEKCNGLYGDSDRAEEAMAAPPLIEERYIEAISWEKRSSRVFEKVTLTNGWEIRAKNSAGDPGQAQGFDAHMVHFDEDVATGGWLEEMIGRTLGVSGFIRWTALPHAKTDDIQQLIEEADEQSGRENPVTEKIIVTIFDNPYIPAKARDEAVASWKAQGDDVYRKRALGELTNDSVRMYPTFHPDTHSAIKYARPDEPDCRAQVQKILTERNGMPPLDWCRYVTFDPGFTMAAAVFWAVPPPELGDFKVAYDELSLESCTAKKFGEAMAYKTRNTHFQDFIIDAHGGKLTDLGSGVLPLRQYEQELAERHIHCENRGPRFLYGSDDIPGREMALRSWLEIRANGLPTFLIVAERCPNTVKSMKLFKKRQVKVHGRETTIDEGVRRGPVHWAECLEYGAAHGLPYVAPPKRVNRDSHVDRCLKARALRRRKRAAKNRGGGRNIALGAIGD